MDNESFDFLATLNDSSEGDRAYKPAGDKDIREQIVNHLPEGFEVAWIGMEEDESSYRDIAKILYEGNVCVIVCLRPLLSKDEKLRQWCAKKKKELNAKLLVGWNGEVLQAINDDGSFKKDCTFPIEDFIIALKDIVSRKEIRKGMARNIRLTLLDIINDLQINNDYGIYNVVSKLTDDFIQKNTTISEKYLLMETELEDMLFEGLIGKFEGEELCRYTTLNTIIRIVSTKKASVTGIACMNDKSECYYVDQYLNNDSKERYLKDMSDDEVKELNTFFIMSCSEIGKQDKLPMWRMYGDEAKGVCIKYRFKQELMPRSMDNAEHGMFYLAPVCYADENNKHLELEFVKRLCETPIDDYKLKLQRLNLWKHFFKPNEYKEEKEVRLLYREKDTSNKYKWITTSENILCPIVEFDICEQGTSQCDLCNNGACNNRKEFPLIIESIKLGPKCPERTTNAAQLRYLAELNNIKCANKNIEFSVSDIDNYR